MIKRKRDKRNTRANQRRPICLAQRETTKWQQTLVYIHPSVQAPVIKILKGKGKGKGKGTFAMAVCPS